MIPVTSYSIWWSWIRDSSTLLTAEVASFSFHCAWLHSGRVPRQDRLSRATEDCPGCSRPQAASPGLRSDNDIGLTLIGTQIESLSSISTHFLYMSSYFFMPCFSHLLPFSSLFRISKCCMSMSHGASVKICFTRSHRSEILHRFGDLTSNGPADCIYLPHVPNDRILSN